MPQNYTGNQSATHSPSPAPGSDTDPIIQLPLGTDGFSTTAWHQALQTLADFASWLTRHSVWRDLASIITGAWVFNNAIATNGQSGDGNAAIQPTAAPTARKLWAALPCGGSVYARIYYVAGSGGVNSALELTINARWDSATSLWNLDNVNGYPWKLVLAAAGTYGFRLYRYNSTSAFNDSSWSVSAQLDPLSGGGVAVLGALSASGSITATQDVTSRHTICNSGTPTIVVTGQTGAGTGATASISGRDEAGLITVNTGSAPDSGGFVATINFATAYSSAPIVVIEPANELTRNLTGNNKVLVRNIDIQANQFKLLAGSPGLTASQTYQWHYLVRGR